MSSVNMQPSEIVVGSNNGFIVCFNANKQTYKALKDGKLLIGDKYRFSDVKSYLK